MSCRVLRSGGSAWFYVDGDVRCSFLLLLVFVERRADEMVNPPKRNDSAMIFSRPGAIRNM